MSFNPIAGFSKDKAKDFLSAYLSEGGDGTNFEYTPQFSADLAQGHQKKIGGIPAQDISNIPYQAAEWAMFGQPGVTTAKGEKGYSSGDSRAAEHEQIMQYVNNPRHGYSRGLLQTVPLTIEQKASDFIRMFGKLGK